jgi:hypothetical protein
MNREVHVRFREGLAVKFRLPTRLFRIEKESIQRKKFSCRLTNTHAENKLIGSLMTSSAYVFQGNHVPIDNY